MCPGVRGDCNDSEGRAVRTGTGTVGSTAIVDVHVLMLHSENKIQFVLIKRTITNFVYEEDKTLHYQLLEIECLIHDLNINSLEIFIILR